MHTRPLDDKIIAQLVYVHEVAYDMLRGSPFETSEFRATIVEAREFASRQVRRVLKYYLVTGKIVHYVDVPESFNGDVMDIAEVDL